MLDTKELIDLVKFLNIEHGCFQCTLSYNDDDYWGWKCKKQHTLHSWRSKCPYIEFKPEYEKNIIERIKKLKSLIEKYEVTKNGK